MEQFLIDNEVSLRKAFFYVPLILFGILEEFFPHRANQLPIKIRWTANFGLMFFNMLLKRVLPPILTVNLAFYAQSHHVGLLPFLAIKGYYGLILGVILLDMMRYFMHRASHAIPLLWRLHRVHHSDVDFDFSTSVRHHPLESLIGTVFDWAAILLLGPPPAAIIFTTIANPFVDLFNHSNIRLPKRLDAVIRWFLVTPDMHRVHHSSYQPETDSNYASFLSCWDRLFRTYNAVPKLGHEAMVIGLRKWESPTDQSFLRLLANPFLRKKSA